MPKCGKCKKTIPSNAKFCHLCGTKQDVPGKATKYYVRPDGLHECIKTIDGKRIPFRGRTDAEVDRKMIEWKARQESGRPFNEVAEEWKEFYFRDEVISYSTQKRYNRPAVAAIEYFNKKPIKQITEDDIEQYFEDLAKQGYTKKTIKAYKSVVNMIFYFERKQIGNYNPVKTAAFPAKCKPSKKRPLPLDAEMDKVTLAFNEPHGLLHFLILYTGVRRGEALALTGKDIDRVNKKVHINKTLYYRNGKPTIKESTKTEAGMRHVPLLDLLDEVLPKELPDGPIFEPEYKTTLERHLRKYRDNVGISCTLHQLRHGFCTFLYEAGVDVKTAQYYMGHSDIKMTQEVYAHIRERKLRHEATKLNDYVNSPQ